LGPEAHRELLKSPLETPSLSTGNQCLILFLSWHSLPYKSWFDFFVWLGFFVCFS